MSKKWRVLSLGLVFVFVVFSGWIMAMGNGGAGKELDVGSIARLISNDVCSVSKVNKGKSGVPILIFEENHISRQGQIQEAIALVRLYEKFNLRHIALEGYLKEHKPYNVNWFHQAAKGLPLDKKAGVAVQLLGEGEISSAEFMLLVYDDFYIHPIETASEYTVKLDDQAQSAPFIYLLKIAMNSLEQKHMARLQTFQEELETLEGDKKEAKRKEMFIYILSANPWTLEKYKILNDTEIFKKLTLEKYMAMMKEIKEKGAVLKIEITSEEKNAMDMYIGFWQKRHLASSTMVGAVEKLSDQGNHSILVMIIGAAHTDRICDLLQASGRPFAVITPLSFSLAMKPGDLTSEMLYRKYDRKSVYSEGFSDILVKTLSSTTQKKPEPVLDEPWFQGKAKLYLFINRIVDKVLASGGAGDKPPFSFSKSDLESRELSIDPNKISVMIEPDGINKSVLFPVVLNPNNPQKKTTLWVKATNNIANISKDEREDVEKMLKKALDKVKTENKMNGKVEDKAGRVQVSFTTVAGFARDQKTVENIMLR